MDTVTSKDGTVIAYDVRGQGPVLIYVTGATCWRTFAPVVRDATAFAAAFTVVTPDRRGRGSSGDTAPWSLDREVEDIESLIDAHGGQAVVYGHSSGAVLALHAAHRLPHKVRAAVLYDAPWVSDDAERKSYARLSERVDVLLEANRPAAALRRFLLGIGMPRPFVLLAPLMPGWRTMLRLAPTLRYDLALTADLPPLELAAQVTVPVHVVVGGRSPVELHRVAASLAETVPGATHDTLKGQDHMVSASALLPLLLTRCAPPGTTPLPGPTAPRRHS